MDTAWSGCPITSAVRAPDLEHLYFQLFVSLRKIQWGNINLS